MSTCLLTSGQIARQRLKFRRTTILTAGFVGVLAGLGLSRLGYYVALDAVLLLALLALLRLPRRSLVSLLLAVACGLSAGLWRGGEFMAQVDPYQYLYGERVVFTATAIEDAVYGYGSQLLFDVKNPAFETDEEPLALPGRIRVSGFGEKMVYRGDVVEVEGKFRSTRGGKQGRISYAQLAVVRHGGTPVDGVRREFAAGMQSALPEPMASFGLGLLTGQRSTLPEQTTDDLSTVGLTHIVAVSGYNLTIIVLFVQRFMAQRSKYQTVLFAGLFMSLFLAVTGLNAAIVRAAIVSTLSLAAWYYGRSFRPLLLISMVAAGTAMWSPLYIWGDLSWYLSFLAFFGVLVVAPALTKLFFGNREPKIVAQTLLETSSAQIMTIPLTLFVFQRTSLVALVSNMLVVPLIPLAMLFSLVAGLAGMLMPTASGWFAWPARIVLTYALDVAAALARVPHALVHYSITAQGLALLYAALVLWVVGLYARLRTGKTVRRPAKVHYKLAS
ncbi:hypothetical protein CR970_00230 [Candidatus Saccharibacteria bacterium]|nr:MAG: hypothetical protein CR970_00230 [Candidatus Saccharibacteria bacterium]